MTIGWCPRLLAIVWAALRRLKREAPLPPGEKGSQLANAHRMSAFVWERVFQAAGAHGLSAFVLG